MPYKKTFRMIVNPYAARSGDLSHAVCGMILRQIAEYRRQDFPDYPCLWRAFIADEYWHASD
jgi:hypothetical protein